MALDFENYKQIDLPMPPEAPVTKTLFPVKSIFI